MRHHRIVVRLFTAVLLAVALPAGWAAEPVEKDTRPITLGVFPYVSATQLVRFHTPLRAEVARILDRPVTLVTAPDFATFIDRTRKGMYDVIFTAPHFGRLAERRDHYSRLVRTSNEIYGVFLVPTGSPIRKIEDLRGKRIMIAQRLAVIYQTAEEQLRRKGLVPGRDVELIETSTHNNAMSAPLRGDADATVLPAALWQALARDNGQRLHEIGRTHSVPGAMIMASRALPAPDIEMLRVELLKFPRSPAGQEYFAVTGMHGFEPITDADAKSLDPYLPILESLP